MVDQLVDNNLISDYGDTYYLRFEAIRSLERMGDKSAHNLIDAIEKSKNNTLGRFIYALGIRHVGEHIADVLARTFHSIDKISEQSLEDLTKTAEIGPVVAQSIYDFFRNPATKKVLKKLKKAGIKFAEKPRSPAAMKLAGKTFVFTGELKGYSRPEAEELIRNLGGGASSSVSKKTDFVVAGENPGSNYEKAKQSGVKIIDEERFNKIIKDTK